MRTTRLLCLVGLAASVSGLVEPASAADGDDALLDQAEAVLAALRGTPHALKAEAALAGLHGAADGRQLAKKVVGAKVKEYYQVGKVATGPWSCPAGKILTTVSQCKNAAKRLKLGKMWALRGMDKAINSQKYVPGCSYRPVGNQPGRNSGGPYKVFWNENPAAGTARTAVGTVGHPAVCLAPPPPAPPAPTATPTAAPTAAPTRKPRIECTGKYVLVGTVAKKASGKGKRKVAAVTAQGPWACPAGKMVNTPEMCEEAARYLKIGIKVWTLRGMEDATNSVRYVPGCSYRPGGNQPGRKSRNGPYKVFFNEGVGTAPGTFGHPSLCLGDDNLEADNCMKVDQCGSEYAGVSKSEAKLDSCLYGYDGYDGSSTYGESSDSSSEWFYDYGSDK